MTDWSKKKLVFQPPHKSHKKEDTAASMMVELHTLGKVLGKMAHIATWTDDEAFGDRLMTGVSTIADTWENMVKVCYKAQGKKR